MNLKKFFEIIRHKVNGGGEFMWNCYGRNAFMLDSNRKEGSVSIVFDLEDQTVYEVTVSDYKDNRAYKYINPSFERSHKKELKDRGFKKDQAWDDVVYEKTTIRTIANMANKIGSKRL